MRPNLIQKARSKIMLGDHDTIAAIATARGTGALSIVRISGAGTPEVVKKCFANSDYAGALESGESHRAFFGLWHSSATGAAIDEVILIHYAEGRGFTGEISVEIVCHGGRQVTDMVLDAALAAGCRLARPGEFTYRAVMSGKLDLTRAESILGLIQARTPRAAAEALNNIRGAFSRKLIEIEELLVSTLANLEASIDFTTEDIQPVQYSDLLAKTRESASAIENLLKGYVANRAARQGLRVVLAGRPNVGKSSLLNQILGRDRSIVTEHAGTTRDTIEEEVILGGNLFRLVDTAGLRSSENEIEKQGVDRALSEIKAADLAVYVVDGSVGIQNDDVERIQESGPTKTLVCFNKSDIRKVLIQEDLKKFGLADYAGVTSTAVEISGTEELKKALIEKSFHAADGQTDGVASTQRQAEGLKAARAAIFRAATLLEENRSPEFVALELKDALTEIQNILGKNAGDDVMDRVFKEFCIGK